MSIQDIVANAGNYQQWTTKDKSTWGDGPWQAEPDKIQWVDPATGLDCLMHRPHGAWCGYVGVPPEHPLHGKGISGWDDEKNQVEYDIDVHGGITYDGALCQESDDPAHGICHIPAEGRPKDVWWFGFDCSHAFDVDPERRVYDRKIAADARAEGDISTAELFERMNDADLAMPGLHYSYKNAEYVMDEVTKLAAQLAVVK